MATEEAALEHIRCEMYARDMTAGDVERLLASRGVKLSSETLSRNLRSGHLTDTVRNGVAVAFGWPANWPDDLPPLSEADPVKRLGSNDEIMQRLDRLEALMGLLLQGQNDLVEVQNSGLDSLRKLLIQTSRPARQPPRQAAQ